MQSAISVLQEHIMQNKSGRGMTKLILKLYQTYVCKKCKKDIDVNSFRSGRIPELCNDCKKQKQLLDLKVRQKRFHLRKLIKQELGI